MPARSGLPQTETNRLESFSDGVFAVAITLLALNLGLPSDTKPANANTLTHALLVQWPVYLAYALSFLTILIMWLNHHTLFRLIRRSDDIFMLLNGLLLLIITTIPFVTNLLATYLLQPDRKVALVVYSGASLLMASTYNRMWAYASHDGRLLDAAADKLMVRGISRQYAFGPFLYLTALGVAFLNADVSLVVNIALAVFFALPSVVTRAIIPTAPS